MYQKYYLRTSRELKRLDSVSRSPVYAHFQESLGGLSTIRAYRQQKRFVVENEWRMDANLRAYFPSVSANRWLAVRLEFLGSVIIFASATFAIISVTTGGGLSAGLVGLAVSTYEQISCFPVFVSADNCVDVVCLTNHTISQLDRPTNC